MYEYTEANFSTLYIDATVVYARKRVEFNNDILITARSKEKKNGLKEVD